ELARGQELHEGSRIEGERADPPARLVGEYGRLPEDVHVKEARLEEKLEVALQPCLRVVHDGNPRELDATLDAIHALQDERVRVKWGHLREEGGVGVYASLEESFGVRQEAPEVVRGEEGLQSEG